MAKGYSKLNDYIEDVLCKFYVRCGGKETVAVRKEASKYSKNIVYAIRRNLGLEKWK